MLLASSVFPRLLLKIRMGDGTVKAIELNLLVDQHPSQGPGVQEIGRDGDDFHRDKSPSEFKQACNIEKDGYQVHYQYP